MLVNRWSGRSPTLLEVVPPTLSGGDAGLAGQVERVARVHDAVELDAVVVPEIRPEVSHGEPGDHHGDFVERVEPRVFAREIRDALGLPVIVDRVVVHAPVAEQVRWCCETVEEFGVEGLVLVGGDSSQVRYPGPGVGEANRELGVSLAQADVVLGNIAIPGRMTQGVSEAVRMKSKANSGAQFFTTQIVYDADLVVGLLEDLEVAGFEPVPILLSLCPVRSEQGIRLLRYLGAQFSDDTLADLAPSEDGMLDRSLDLLMKMVERIESSIEARGLHAHLGYMVAPVGNIPVESTVELLQRLRGRVPLTR